MKKRAAVVMLLAAVLLTGCGDDAPPVPIETVTLPPETTAITETAVVTDTTEALSYDQQMEFGFYMSGYISDQDAEAIVSEIHAQEEIPMPDSDQPAEIYYKQMDLLLHFYAQNMYLHPFLPDSGSETIILDLYEQYGWLFTIGERYYKAPEDVMQRICKKQFELSKNDADLSDDEPFSDHGLKLETCDVPEGSYYFDFLFQSAEHLNRAEYQLTDSGGNEISMLIVSEMVDFQNDDSMRSFTILTDTPLRQGTYTLTIAGVSADFSVIPAQDFVEAEKLRRQAEREKMQAELDS